MAIPRNMSKAEREIFEKGIEDHAYFTQKAEGEGNETFRQVMNWTAGKAHDSSQRILFQNPWNSTDNAQIGFTKKIFHE